VKSAISENEKEFDFSEKLDEKIKKNTKVYKNILLAVSILFSVLIPYGIAELKWRHSIQIQEKERIQRKINRNVMI